MKMMKTALLATAAIAAVATSANANELADLKAQIEALNARISQVEAAPAVPAGYQLVSITKGQALKFGLDSDVDGPATLISVLPAADAPAGTVVSVSGSVKAGLVYSQVDDGEAPTLAVAGVDINGNGLFTDAGDRAPVAATPGNLDNSLDVDTGAAITIAGVTDTAVGEVGAKVNFDFTYAENSNGGMGLDADGWWGYWEFADGMKLGGGRDGSLAGVGGIETNTKRLFTSAHGTHPGAGDQAQIRLSYASGPLGFAVAVEDASRTAALDGDDDALGVAAEMTYAGDMFSLELAGGMWGEDDLSNSGNQKMIVGGSVGFNVAEGVSLTMGSHYGKFHNGNSTWAVSGSAKAAIADGIELNLGAGHRRTKAGATTKTNTVVGGIYYSPVSQLVVGLEADWFSETGSKTDGATVAFVTKYSF
jgi:hypothetical protein